MELSPYLQNRWCARKGDGPGSPRAPSARRHPNQRLQWAVDRSRGLIMSALQLVSTLRPSGFACKLFRFLSFGTCPAAHDEPLPAALGFCALGKVARRLAEMLRRRRPQGGGGLTSGGVSLILPRSALRGQPAKRQSGGGGIRTRVRERAVREILRA